MTATLHTPAPTRLNPGATVQAVLIACAFMPMLGGATIAPALPKIQEQFADQPGAAVLTGMILSTHALAIMLFSPLAGWVGDRFGRKTTLLAGLGLFTVAGVSGLYLPTLPTILVGRFLLGVGIAFVMTSMSGLVGDLFDEEHRRRLMGRQGAAATGGGVLFMLGAGALASLGWREAFLMYLVGIVVFIPALLTIPRPRPIAGRAAESDASDRSAGEETGVGLGFWLLAPVGAMFLMQVLFYVIPTQVPGVLQNGFGLTPFQTSMCTALMAVSMAPSSLFFAKIRRLAGPSTLLTVSFGFPVVGFAVLASADAVWSVTAGLMIAAAGMGFVMPVINDWIISTAADGVRGRALGMLTTGLFAGQFMSPVITQPLINLFGLSAVFGGVAIASAGVSAGFWMRGRRLARTPRLAEVV